MNKNPKAPKGRGSAENIHNRFEKVQVHLDEPAEFSIEPGFQNQDQKHGQKSGHEDVLQEDQKPAPQTQFFKDQSQSVLTQNNSPDIPFNFSVNPYRGCEHGCAYCYARPTHEYLGMSAGLDFETKIFVKENAPDLLRKALMAKKWVPQNITFSGVTDCYQPAERKLALTRRCLEVALEFKNPVSIITKNALVTRDIDLFTQFASFNGVMIMLSLTTLDDDLCSILEPRTSRPEARLKAIRQLAQAGIPVGINIAPVIPALNDHEIPALLKAAAQAGAKFAGYTALRLPLTVAPLFEAWLERHKPERKEKVLNHIRDLRGGLLNSAKFGDRMRGQGAFAENLRQMFRIYCAKEGLNKTETELSAASFKRPGTENQLKLF